MKKNAINLAAVILAGGKGMRMGGNYKQFIKIGGKPVLFYSLREFINASCVEKIIIVVPYEKINYAKNIVSRIDSSKSVAVIAGGLKGFKERTCLQIKIESGTSSRSQ